MFNFKKIIVAAGLITLTTGSILYHQSAYANMYRTDVNLSDESRITQSMLNLHVSMRQLAEEEMVYTRNLIVSSVANLEDVPKVTERILKIQDQIADAFKSIYGEELGKKIAPLLKDNVNNFVEVITIAKTGDKDKTLAAKTKWRASTEAIVELMSTANPNLQKQTILDIANKGIDTACEEVAARLRKDWDADIAALDKGHEQLLMLTDTLTAAIIKQFPEKFL